MFIINMFVMFDCEISVAVDECWLIDIGCILSEIGGIVVGRFDCGGSHKGGWDR